MRDLHLQLQIREIRLNPGQEWAPPSGEWRFILLESGAAYWLEEAKPRELAQGELLIVSPAPAGCIRASQLCEAVLHWFGFGPGSILGIFSVAEREWIEHEAEAVLGTVLSLPSTHPIAKEMATLRGTAGGNDQLVRRAKAFSLALNVLTQSMPPLQSEVRRGGAAKERFEQIISRMPDAELIQHSSEELARLCGCTPRHFNRLFRLRFGAPTRVRQTELRLIKARQLLQDSNETVAQVAADCGYQSLSLFNSLFRRRFGVSPSEWRGKALR